MKYNKGFTLIELIVVVAIIGILAAVAYPSYTDSVKKGKRADGIDGLLYEAARLEEYYLNNDSYTSAVVSRAQSSDQHYNMSVVIAAGGFSYTVTATPVLSDPECLTLSLDSLGQQTSTGSSSDCW